MPPFARVVVLAATCASSAAPASGAAQSPPSNLARAADAVAYMRRAQFDSASSHFSDRLRTEIPPARLRDIWGQLTASLGDFQRADSASTQGKDVVVPVFFARLRIDMTFTFDGDGRVTSLAMRPAPAAPRTPPPPSTAQPASFPLLASARASDRLFARGRFAEARDSATAELARDATNADVHVRLGSVALLENRPADAQAHLTRARALGRSDRPVTVALAEAYSRQRNARAAEEEYRQIGMIGAADKFASFSAATPYELTFRAATVRVPFVRTDPLPVIEIAVNGHDPAYFLVDTGAGETILDTAFAARAGARQFGADTTAFAGGQRAASRHGTVDSMRLGALTVRRVPVRVQPTRVFQGAAGGLRVDGIVGTGLFRELRAALDYPRGELRLSPRDTPRPRETGDTRVPMWLASDHLMLAWGHIGVPGAATDSTLMLVDTGLVGATFVAPDTVFRAAGIAAGAGQAVTGLGGGGTVTARMVTLPALTFGGVTRREVTAMMGVFPPTLETQFGYPVRGLVSHEILRPFSVTFDFAAMEIVLTPR